MTTNTWPGWECEELLGEGSYGKVFRISREEFGTTYQAALKVITIPKSKSEIESAYAEGMDEQSVTTYFRSCVEDIVAEFALMSQLKGNSNIVSYEDHMVVPHEDGIGWDILIRMELLTPLIAYCKNHPLKEADVIRLGADLAKALKLCRKKGILHRDIKPENIFVNEDGDFKLGDFGVARVAEKTVSAMSQKGTYMYMAPEVYKGEPYGYSADLYSLGLVLYRLMNDNRMPFMPPAPAAIKYSDREKALNARMSDQPMEAPAHGSDAFKNIILKACAYAPADRYAGAEELEQDLSMLHMDQKSVYKQPEREQSSLAVMEEEDEEDDFEKTVSSYDSYQPKRDKSVSAQEPSNEKAVTNWMQETQEDEEDDFDKTVSSFSGHQPKKRETVPTFEDRQEEKKDTGWEQPAVTAAACDEGDEEDDFEKTISKFDSYQPKKKTKTIKEEIPVPQPEEEEEDEFDKTVSAFTQRGAKKPADSVSKPDLMKIKEEKQKTKEEKRNTKEKKKGSGRGKKIVIALVISVAVGIFLPPVGIGLAALSLPFIFLSN